ncbi:MAG: MBL fold metallo-hydrolase [bacterium]
MKRNSGVLLFCLLLVVHGSAVASGLETDTLSTAAGDLQITFVGHGSLMFTFAGKIIHVDPFSQLADYSTLPPADLVLITHEHRDHLDPDALQHVRTDSTAVVLTATCASQLDGGIVLNNGDEQTVMGLEIEAVPAYNIQHKRPDGQPFHPPGIGNGYVVTFGDKRVYIAGDTENIPEMRQLEDIDMAFLPMNLPYTMTPEMVAEAATVFRPAILYPYHFGDTDTGLLLDLLADINGVEVRIRQMQ